MQNLRSQKILYCAYIWPPKNCVFTRASLLSFAVAILPLTVFFLEYFSISGIATILGPEVLLSFLLCLSPFFLSSFLSYYVFLLCLHTQPLQLSFPPSFLLRDLWQIIESNKMYSSLWFQMCKV